MSDFKYSLMDLTNDFRQIMEMMDDPDLDPQTLKDTMEGIEGALEDKFDGYAAVIRIMTSQMKLLKEEKDRIEARMKSWENNVKRMKELMTLSMQTTGKVKFKTAQNSFWVQKNPESVVVDAKSFEDIPEDFLRYKDPEPDKEKMKTAIKAGADLTSIAHIEQTEGVRFR